MNGVNKIQDKSISRRLISLWLKKIQVFLSCISEARDQKSEIRRFRRWEVKKFGRLESKVIFAPNLILSF